MTMIKRHWGLCILIIALWSTDIVVGTDRFVSSATGDDLNGLNDCRDQARPCATLKQAVEKAGPGDFIKILPGPPYTQDCGIEIKKRLTILAEGVRPVIAPVVAVDEFEKPCEGKGFLFRISGDAAGSRIEGLTIRARIKEKGDAALIIIENTGGSAAIPAAIIKDNQLQVVKIGGDSAEVGTAIRVLNSSFVEIIGNQVQGAREPVTNAQGITLEQKSGGSQWSLNGIRIEENKIFNHGKAGIEVAVEDRQPSPEHPIRLLRNRIERNEGHGISIVGASHVVIESNELVANGLTGVDFLSPCPHIDKPDAACESLTLNANVILNNEDEGILLRGAPVRYNNLKAFNNVIQRNGLKSERAGLRLAKGLFTLSQLQGNRLEGNYRGIQIEELEGGSSLEVIRNTVSSHKGDGIAVKLTDSIAPISFIVRDTIIEQNNGIGFSLEGFNTIEGSTILVESTISRGNNEGIVLKGSQQVKLQSSQIKENRCSGLVLENSSANVMGNIIVLNGRSCPNDKFQLEGAGITLKGSSNKNIVERNVLDRNLNGISLRLGAGDQQREGNGFQCNVISTSDHSGILVLPEAGVTVLPDSFKNNNIVGNISFGLRNFTNIAINAQQNWWGDKSGPRHETNPNGKGDRILGPANFGDWLDKLVDINRCP
jgi:hypothetical protein